MRDPVLFLIVFGGLVVTLVRPFVGIVLWVWLSLMNPQRLTWGFAYDFPFAEIVGLTTLAAWIFSPEPKRLPLTRTTGLLIAFTLWVTITTVFAANPEAGWVEWSKFIKVELSTFLMIAMLTNAERIHPLVWTMCLSLGYFGIRNGISALLHGGAYRVTGPSESQLSDNNNFGTACVMLLPLLWYLYYNTRSRLNRIGLLGAFLLTILTTLATYSRGAFLAIAVTGAVLWLKSGRKLIIGSVFGLIVVALVSVLPLAWFTRMDTIGQYQQDYSVVGRFEAWGHAVNVAMARPLTGGGMGTFTAGVFAQYSPGVEWRAPHSIYFQALGEQGFIGLALFAAIWLCAFADCRWVMKRTRDLPELKWAYDLASMVQLSMIAYATGGAFLSLVYLDFYYMLVAVAVALRSVVAAQLVLAPDRSAAVPRVRVARVPAASPVLGRPRSPP